MRYILTILLFFVCIGAFSQKWHEASKKLKPSKSPSAYYITVGYFNRYDTIPCTYITSDNPQAQNGFKFVYVRNGQYIDDSRTFHVFYDKQFHQVYNVQKFYF